MNKTKLLEMRIAKLENTLRKLSKNEEYDDSAFEDFKSELANLLEYYGLEMYAGGNNVVFSHNGEDVGVWDY